MKNKGKLLIGLGLAMVVMIAGCMALILPNGFGKRTSFAFGSVTGSGTQSDPYICTIGDVNTLNGSGSNQFRGHVVANINSWVVYKLTDNINLSSISNWTPITLFGPNMTFDGGKYEIQNLKNTGTGTAQGFIANLQGTVKDVTFTNVSMTGSGNLRGVVAATVARTATSGTISAVIDNVHVAGGIVTGVRAGGLVGAVGVTAANGNGNQNDARLVNLTIKDSSNNASVGIPVTAADNTTANSGVGGLVGYVRQANLNIEGSHNTGTITLRSSGKHVGLGGLVGMVNDTAPTGDVQAIVVNVNSSYNGGVVSFTRNSVDAITSDTSSNNAGTRNNWQATGGLIGLLFSSNSTANNDGIVSQTDRRIELNISGCYNSNLVQCYSYATSDIRATAGGFIGLTGGVGISTARPALIKNSYNTGSVRAISWLAQNNQSSTSNAGGMIGFLDSSIFKISSCYNSGAMYSHARVNNSSNNSIARANCGGILGDQNGLCTIIIENCASNGTLDSSYTPSNANTDKSTYGIGPIDNTTYVGDNYSNSPGATGTGSGASSTVVEDKIAEIIDMYKSETLGVVYVDLVSDVENFTFAPEGQPIIDTKGYKVYKGEEFKFTITPVAGFEITSVQIGGVEQNAPSGAAVANTYTVTTNSDMDDEQVITVEVAVAAHEYTLTFNPNNGENATSEELSVGASISAPAEGTFTKNGYEIAGWFEDADLTMLFDFNTFTTMPARDVTLWAKWTPLSNIVVTFNANVDDGGTTLATPSIANKTVTFDATYGNLATISRVGYTFNGWFTAESGGDLIDSATQVIKYQAHTLYAQWTAKADIKVTFDTNKGSGSTTPTTPSQTFKNVTFDDTYDTLPTTTRVGYAFKGWFTSASDGSKVTSTTSVITATNHTLYAQWTVVTGITVTFNINKGDGTTTPSTPSPTSKSLTFDGTYEALPTITRDGYTFNGWFTLASGGTKVEATTNVTNDQTHEIFAQWSANTIVVTFNVNRGEGSTNPSNPSFATMNVTFNNTYVALPTINRVGYSFDGWFPSASSGVKVETTTKVENHDAHTLYAQWTAIDNIVVTLDLNDTVGSTRADTTPSSITVTFDGTYVGLPTSVDRIGYTFNGWFTSASGGTEVTSTTIVTNSTAHTLHAQWTAQTVTVTFDVNKADGTSSTPTTPNPTSIIVTFDGTYNFDNLPAISRDGYRFEGWSLLSDGDLITADTKVTNSETHKLYAKWEAKNNIIVTFDVNQRTGTVDLTTLPPSQLTVTFDGEYPTLDLITRKGYDFKGWFTTQSGNDEVEEGDDVTNSANHTLYAKWTAKTNISVTFIKNDVKAEDPSHTTATVTFDLAYGSLPTITYTDSSKSFGGWWTGNGAVDWGSRIMASTIVTNESHNLYARWNEEQSYTITFHTNGGTAVEPISGFVTDNITLPGQATVTKNGYTFDGWYENDATDGGNWGPKVESVTISDHDVDLYAQWTARNDISVTFNKNDVEAGKNINATTPSKASMTVTFASAYGSLATISSNGYDFVGWFTSAIGGTKVTDATIVTDYTTHTLYAQWTAKTVTVTFDKNGATNNPSLASKPVTFDSEYGALAEISRNGYTFDGWFTLASDGDIVSSTTKVSNAGNHNLYAKWTARTDILVTFDLNKGTGSSTPANSGNQNVTVTFDGNYVGLPTSTNVTRDGYNFAGWSLTRDGNVITASTKVTNSADHTLYAKWTAKTVAVKFNANDSIGTTDASNLSATTKNVTFDQTYGDLATIERNGYAFAGWFDATTGGTQITSGTSVIVTSPTLDLYARWTAKTDIVITFDVNDTVGSTNSNSNPSSINVTFDGTYGTLPTLTRDGYSYDGWSLTRGGDLIGETTSVILFANHTLYAKWTEENITVSFDKNGGSGTAINITPKFDSAYGTLPSTVSRNGYAFDGWFTLASGGSKVTPTTMVTNFTGHTLYAQWTANTIEVTFDANKGNGSTTPSAPSMLTKDVTFDGEYGNLAEISRDGYTFAGWWTEATAGTQITATDDVTNSADHTLYAHWTANLVKIIFNVNDTVGSTNASDLSMATKNVTFDGTYGDLATIKRVGYTFEGWSLTINGDIITSETIVLNHLTHNLYAKWTAKTVKVTFDVNDTVGSTNANSNPSFINVTFDGKYVGLPTISRVGYTFDGWFTLASGGDLVTSASNVLNHDEHELHAQWTAISYTITFNSKGGSAVSSITSDFDTDISGMEPSDPTRIGHTFGGWYTVEEPVGTDLEFVFDVMKGNIILFAKWVALPDIKYDIIISAIDSTDGTELDDNILKAIFDMQSGNTQFIVWGTEELEQPAGYTFGGYSIIAKDGTPEPNLPSIFGQFSNGFLWINMNNIPDDYLYDQGAGNPLIKIFAYYNKEYTITLKYDSLPDDLEVYVSLSDGYEYHNYRDPKDSNSFAAFSDIKIEVSQRGNYELSFYLDDLRTVKFTNFIPDGEGGYLFTTLSDSLVLWIEAKLSAITLVKETLTKTANGDIRGSKLNMDNYQIDVVGPQNVGVNAEGISSDYDFVTWYLNFNGELIDIINDNRVKSYFVIGANNVIESISFSDLRAFKNRSNEIVLVALFSEKVQLNISVSDNAPAGHNNYELQKLVNGQWESLGEFPSTSELLAYGEKYRIYHKASKFYDFAKFEGTDITLGDVETDEYLEFTLTVDRNITINFLSKEFTMVVTKTTSNAKGTWSYDAQLIFTVGDTINISFDTASFYKLNKMTIGTKNAGSFADYGMVLKNGTITIDVTVEWLAKAFDENWLDLSNPANCKFNANIGADTPLSPIVIAGGSIAGAIAVAVIVMITLSIISIRRKKQDYAAALVKHREGMARLNQNIVSDLVNG